MRGKEVGVCGRDAKGVRERHAGGVVDEVQGNILKYGNKHALVV